ncbi:MAG: ABC transporter ATP-binding protein [Mariprofundus sp.]
MSDDAISVVGLSKSFGGQVVVHGIDLQVRAGEIFAFVGPNGSGKTTTIRMLCGLLTPDAGTGHCLGFDLLNQYSEIKQHAGYMSQGFSLYSDLTVVENLRFAARIHQLGQVEKRVAEALSTYQLQDYANHLAGALSGGWKQRLSLACALMHEPALLLLDEPTGGVDPESRRSFWHMIRQKAALGVAVLVSTHYLEEVALYADRLAYIHSGSILISGTLQSVMQQSGLSAFRLPLLDNPQLSVLEQEEGVITAEVISGHVMITGPDAAALEQMLSRHGLLIQAEAVQPGLEDLFFYLARQRHCDA